MARSPARDKSLSLRLKLVRLADAYCKATQLTRATVSDRVFGAGHRIDRIATDSDLMTATYERAVEWFSRHWPEAASWPHDMIERPKKEAV